MKQVVVRLAETPGRDYTIFIGRGILESIASLHDLSRYSKLFVVTDKNVAPLYLDRLVRALPGDVASVVLPAGEKHKDIETVQKIWNSLHEAGCDRRSLVINLGGGVMGDLGGFAASTYMRGMDFLNVPTTLLAQVDASIGGKTGFSFAGIKNLIGNFDQPAAIFIDTEALATLPEREFIAGFGEVVKHGLVADAAYFRQVTSKSPRELSPEELEDIIAKSCQIKQQIVQDDVKESGSRRLANLGHSVGHALESLSLETDTPLLHGEAVSVGILAEARISEYSGDLSATDVRQIEEALKRVGLPTKALDFGTDKILAKMQSDKKNEYGTMNFTLLKGIGRAVHNQTAPLPIVEKAIRTILT